MTLRSLTFRLATAADDLALRSLLESAGLPSADVATGADQRYLLAFDGDRLVGSVGLELAGTDALARSLAVLTEYRRDGLATALNGRILDIAREHGIRNVYLLTTTAADFASRRGYERISRSDVPEAIAGLAQFRSLCPATAVCMRRTVERG